MRNVAKSLALRLSSSPGTVGNAMEVHLVDGTYELFRHFHGQPSRKASDGREIAAVRGVLLTVLQMLGDTTTHIGVATDHVVESFRNELWPGYKDSTGIPPELLAQFELLEEALNALGVVVWPMVDVEADDAMASAATLASAADGVERVVIFSPDKDLAQCVVGQRVVQLDRRSGDIRDEAGVVEKFGVPPVSIPDWLALVGDSADGFPGLPGWGARSASLARYGSIKAIPDAVAEWDPALRKAVRSSDKLAQTLATGRDLATLFHLLATLRCDLPLFGDVEETRWLGPTEQMAQIAELLRDASLYERATRLSASRAA
jgi:5'-3' exonuclease